ncbi:hypothetical protein AKJ16_DCAP27686 [Drosera capensis]
MILRTLKRSRVLPFPVGSLQRLGEDLLRRMFDRPTRPVKFYL